jgi:hypothetical protein
MRVFGGFFRVGRWFGWVFVMEFIGFIVDEA